MSDGSYDHISAWYDAFLRENPIYTEVVVPAMLGLVGDVSSLDVCDVACGQGLISRELARRGARVTGVDISARLLDLAHAYQQVEPLGIRYLKGDARTLHALPSAAFDVATCSMALMNISDIEASFQAVHRILRPGGIYAFTITHPCFQTPFARWVDTPEGEQVRQVSSYLRETFWTGTRSDDVRSRQGEYHRTLATYLNGLVDAGFTLQRLIEPAAGGESARLYPGRAHIPPFLGARWRA